MLLPQLGPIILEKVSTYEQVGFFGAASKIPAVLYQIPGVIAAAFIQNYLRLEMKRILMNIENYLSLN